MNEIRLIDANTLKTTTIWGLIKDDDIKQGLTFAPIEVILLSDIDEAPTVIRCATYHHEQLGDIPAIYQQIQGEWVENKRYRRKGKRFFDCSVCHYGENGDVMCETTKIPNFCPNCGARMRMRGDSNDDGN